jgi:fibronectin-binding autotransporter adhesin
MRLSSSRHCNTAPTLKIGRRGRKFLIIAVFGVAALNRHAGADTSAAWTNQGGDQVWTDAANWNINQVPNNSGSATFSVTIGSPAPTVLNHDITVDSADIVSGGVLQSNGQFGLSTVSGGSINNAGIVDPDGTVLALTASSMTNTSLMEATDGATLNLSAPDTNGLSIANTGGTIAANGTNSIVNIGGSVNGGLLTTNDGAITLNSGTLTNLLIGTGSQVSVNGVSVESMAGTITNDGTFTLGLISFSGGTLDVPNGGTISGSGALAIDKGSIIVDSGTLTVGAGQTVEGYGSMSGTFVFQNVVDADSSGNGLSINQSNLTNTGTLEATDGGALQLSGSAIANAGGTISAIGTNSSVNVSSSVTGGVLSSSDGGEVSLGPGSLTNVLIASGSQVYAPNGEDVVSMFGTLTNNGTLTFYQANSLGAELDVPTNAILAGSGELSLQGGIVGVDSGTLTIQSPQLVEGTGQFLGNVNNQSVIDSNLSGQAISFSDGTLTNSGTIEANAGGTLNFTNPIVNNTGGTIAATGSGSFISLSTALSGGMLSATGGATVFISGGSLTNVTVGSGSPVSISNGATEQVSGTLTNNGTITLNPFFSSGTDLNFQNGGVLNGDGTVMMIGGPQISVGSGSLTIGAQQTIEGSGQLDGTITNQGTILANVSGSTLLFNGSLTNEGTVQATGGGAIQLASNSLTSGTYEADSASAIFSNEPVTSNGATIILNGSTATFPALVSLATNTGTLSLENGNTFSTTGSLSNSGTISVDAASALTVNGGYSQTAGATKVAGLLTINGSSLSLTGGDIDLASGRMIINYGSGADPVSSVFSYLASGRNGGSWNGPGIISSTVAALNAGQSALIYSVGYADGADGIVSGLSSGEIEILPTLAGDAKMQGNVVFGDFQLLSQYFGDSGTSWDEGNFTYGSSTNFGDFQLLSQNFGASASALTAGQLASLNSFAAQFGDGLQADSAGGFSVVSVPEPATTGLLAVAGIGLLARKRKRSNIA